MKRWMIAAFLVVVLALPVQAWADIEPDVFIALPREVQQAYVFGFFAAINLAANVESLERRSGFATLITECHTRKKFSVSTIVSMTGDLIRVTPKERRMPSTGSMIGEVLGALCVKEATR